MVANVDVARGVDVGLAGPLNVAFGAEFRRENYQISPASPTPTRRRRRSTSSAAAAARRARRCSRASGPSNEVDASRNNVAVYVDLEGRRAPQLRLGLAGRFEHYSDFGSTADGKVTARCSRTALGGPRRAPAPASARRRWRSRTSPR